MPGATRSTVGDAPTPVVADETGPSGGEAPERPRPSAEIEATFGDLSGKAARRDVVRIPTYKDDKLVDMLVTIQAIGHVEYDELVADHRPTRAQKEKGDSFNADTFAPELLSRCMIKPKVTVAQATELYTSPNWAGGEINDLFMACVRLCQGNFNVPFSGGA